jgi:hypothetical protein
MEICASNNREPRQLGQRDGFDSFSSPNVNPQDRQRAGSIKTRRPDARAERIA